MDFLTKTLGRILFALPFGIFGIFHFLNAGQMEGMVPFPPAIVWIYLTGAALIAACISILINKKARIACILLGIMLLIFVVAIHLPSVLSGDQMAVTNLLKDTALAGAAFTVAGISKD